MAAFVRNGWNGLAFSLMKKPAGFMVSAFTAVTMAAGILVGTATSTAEARPASVCPPRVDAGVMEEIADVSAPENNRTLQDARDNVTEIAELWGDAGDPRGGFAVVYKEILDTTVPSIERGDYADSQWAEDLALDFVQRYLEGVYAHATDVPVPAPWELYYRTATDCEHSGGRVATSGMSAHLLLDLPAALAAVETPVERWDDFNKYGEVLGAATPNIIREIKADYGTDLTELFSVSIVGDVIGSDRAAGIFFQTVRAVAWISSRALMSPATEDAGEAAMWAEWRASEVVLDTAEAIGIF
ncbi:Uncharacterised protein [Rhodococcus coprophilus]|uniref:Uncharacterized protein n=2 Tax=Rhodococcus coprophilus TaxID=38310 RepID=A0A2X4UGA0_9NOCA|nr:Uncharacterised protein [Rhodococcus coprophilus]